tara:strand:- start:789 stop:2159 length:1371 start_codon:yes stop_codon:yes gene_type:complete
MQWSLEDIYKKQVRGNIPPRKHLSVLGEAQVTIEFDDGNKKIVDMDDKHARKLLKLSDQAETNEVQKWIESGGWDSADAQSLLTNQLNTIYTETIQLNNAGIREQFYEQVKELTDLKNNGRLHILQEALESGQISDIYLYLNTKLKSMFPVLVNVESLKRIGNIGFSEGAVGVGPGEALLTLFTEGSNPARGDIELPNGDEVELKAGEGRPGKTRVAGLVRNFENFTKEQYVKAEIDPGLVNNAKDALTKILNYEFNIPETSVPKIEEVKQVIKNHSLSVEEIAKSIATRLKGASYWGQVTDAQGNEARSVIIKLAELVNQNNAGNTKRAKEFFRTATPEGLVEGLSKFSSRPKIAIPIIKRGLRAGGNRDRGDLALAIAMAFQITEYYDELKQKFVYYTLFNKKDGLLVTWGPFTGNYEEDANRTLDNIMKSFDSVKVSADSGGRTGYNLAIKKV